MKHCKRKRDVFEKYPSQTSGPIKISKIVKDEPTQNVTYRYEKPKVQLENADYIPKLGKSIPKLTKPSLSQDTTFDLPRNSVLVRLLQMEEQHRNSKEHASEDFIETNFPPEEVEFMRNTRRLLGLNQKDEKEIKLKFQTLFKARKYLEELNGLDSRAKENLKTLSINKMTIGSEMESRITFIKEAMHNSQINLSKMRRMHIQKMKIVKTLTDTAGKIDSSIAILDNSSQGFKDKFDQLKTKNQALDQEITAYKAKVDAAASNVMRQNHEFYKENNHLSVLREQIHYIKGGSRAIGTVATINNSFNPFEYEIYFKSSGNHTITLLNSDKFNIKLSSVSPSKRPQTVEQPMKWVFSSSSFGLDRLIHENKQMAFYNYDHNRKLYAELEIPLKLSLYLDGESILRKLSFNRPEFSRLLNMERLTVHMNIDSYTDVIDSYRENSNEPMMRLKDYNVLFRSQTPSDNKTVLLFFGSRNMSTGPKLLDDIYKNLGVFENDIIKVNNIKFRVERIDKETQKFEEAKVCENYEDFANCFEFYTEELYENLVVVTVLFEVTCKLNETTYAKKLHLIFMDAPNIENFDRFVRQLKMIVNKEKIITTKDKAIEKIENLIKGINRFVMIAELPNLIKRGSQAQDEYMKLRNILDLMNRLRK